MSEVNLSGIFDTHAHYCDSAFHVDRDELLAQLFAEGLSGFVEVTYDRASNRDALTLAKRYKNVYATTGFHPCDCGDLTEGDFRMIQEHAKEEKVVAIGEIGLDYHWDNIAKDVQRQVFSRQLELAKSLDLPIVVHSRDAGQDTYDILAAHGFPPGVIHCYSYSVELSERFLQAGYFLGVGGVVTYKNGKKLKRVVEAMPLDRLVLETDSPYLSPEPRRGRRNDSRGLCEVLEHIHTLTGEEVEDLKRRFYDNACRLYRLPQ